MKKLLFVMQSLYNGGAEKSLVNLLNEIPEGIFEIDILLFKKQGLFLSQVPSWVNVLDTPDDLKKLYAPLGNSGSKIITKIVGTLISRIREQGLGERKGYRWEKFYSRAIKEYPKHYDLAIAYISGEVLYYVNDKINATKKIVWIHNDYIAAKHPRDYDYPYLKNMDAIVSISNECVNILRNIFPEFDAKIFNIANITSAKLVQKKANEFLPVEYDDGLIITSVGRLDIQKGFDLAIEAAAILKNKVGKFKWLVIGDGPVEKELQKKIKSYNVSECFELLGAKENPYPYIKNCTIFVQPSRYEGKSVVLDEAKILAKPIVVTNYPTVRDQIRDGDEGVIVEMTPKAIASGIEELLVNKDKRNGIQGYLSAHEYGNEDEVKKYIHLFNNL